MFPSPGVYNRAIFASGFLYGEKSALSLSELPLEVEIRRRAGLRDDDISLVFNCQSELVGKLGICPDRDFSGYGCLQANFLCHLLPTFAAPGSDPSAHFDCHNRSMRLTGLR